MSILKNLELCWLSPRGQIVINDREFDPDRSWHEDLALCILRDIWKLESKMGAFKKVHMKFSNSSTEELENLKWIRLHKGATMSRWILSERITKKQELVILDWCMENDRPFQNSFI